MTDEPFDRGLQPERTLLAWRRTALSLAVVAAAVVRFAAPLVGLVAGVVGIACLALVAWAYISAGYRYRRIHRALVAAEATHSEGALPLFALSIAAVLLVIVGIVYVLVAAGR